MSLGDQYNINNIRLYETCGHLYDAQKYENKQTKCGDYFSCNHIVTGGQSCMIKSMEVGSQVGNNFSSINQPK